MVAAQPTLADQSDDILGTWECNMVSDGFSGTTQFTFVADGTGENNWNLRWKDIQRVTDSEITWYITDGVLFHHHSHSIRRKYVTGGVDQTHSLIGKLLWKPPHHDNGDPATIVTLTSEKLELSSTQGSQTETCTRLLNS